MKVERSRRMLQDLLDKADVRIDGDRPWDIRVRDPRVFARVLAGRLAGARRQLHGRLVGVRCRSTGFSTGSWAPGSTAPPGSAPRRAAARPPPDRILNPQRPSRAFEVGRRHYDLGNDLFHAMLDRRMIYSCALWEAAETLDEAQEAKLDLICRKLRLEPGMRVLDIGCGWGGLARYAAEAHGVRVTGVTVSERQVECGARGLRAACRSRSGCRTTASWRAASTGSSRSACSSTSGSRTTGPTCRSCTAAWRTAASSCCTPSAATPRCARVDPWVRTHIFPNSMLPSAAQIAAAAEGLFVLEDWHSFGPHYDRTLMAWHANFVAAWERLRAAYDERFYRMWRYYLLSSAGAFRARSNQLWQIVFSKGGLRGGYRPVRPG